jgi:hypothetical protein
MSIKSPRLFLTLLAALSALLVFNFTLRLLHMLPARGRLGIYEFFDHDLLGAILWAVVSVLWVYLTIGLLRRDPNGWVLSLVLSAATLVLAGASLLGESNWRAALPVAALNGLILVLCLLPGTRGHYERQLSPTGPPE